MTTRDRCGIYQGGARFHPSIAVTLDRDQCRNVRAKLWKKSPSSGSLKATFIISDPGTEQLRANQKVSTRKVSVHLTVKSIQNGQKYGHIHRIYDLISGTRTSFFTLLEGTFFSSSWIGHSFFEILVFQKKPPYWRRAIDIADRRHFNYQTRRPQLECYKLIVMSERRIWTEKKMFKYVEVNAKFTIRYFFSGCSTFSNMIFSSSLNVF